MEVLLYRAKAFIRGKNARTKIGGDNTPFNRGNNNIGNTLQRGIFEDLRPVGSE